MDIPVPHGRDRVSLRLLLVEFLRVFLSFVLAQFALGIWYIISFVLASGSHVPGVWVLLRSGCNAWYNSGHMFCVGALVALEEFTQFLRDGRLVS